MARERKQPDIRRNEILDAALTLFIKEGFINVTVNDIAKKTGVARTTIYEYYSDKTGMLIDIVDRAIATFEITEPEGDHVFDKLTNLATNMLMKINANREIYTLIFREAPILSNEVSQSLIKWRYDNAYVTRQIMEEAANNHLLHPDVSIDTAVFIFTAILGQRAGDCLITGETINEKVEAKQLGKIIWRSIAK